MKKREIKVTRETLERLKDRLQNIPSDDEEIEMQLETERDAHPQIEEVWQAPEAEKEIERFSEQLTSSLNNLLPRWTGNESELDLNRPVPRLTGDTKTRAQVLRWKAEIEANLRTLEGDLGSAQAGEELEL
ncbi:MAG: hypothetical protein KAY24_08100 [Candidatus Eisenbacteria sp.]|nr:hypothetical protein [Candidatus Eisenbacteria bacterium]